MANPNKPTPHLYSVEAEAAVIGGLLLDNTLFDEVISKINSADFHFGVHQVLFKGMTDLIEAGKPADLLTLDEYLKQKNLLKEVGGFAYLAEISKNTPSAANVSAYADVVLLHSKHRQLLKLGQFIVDQTQAAKTAEKLESVIDEVEKQITEFSLSDTTKSAADLSDIFANMLSRMELSAKNGDPVTGTPTGIQDIDEATTGGQAGDLIVIGARPSMGKTAFSQTIAYHTLEKFESAPVFYHSMEMPAEQILQRFLAMRARVSLQDIRQADRLDDEDWGKLTIAMGYILEHWKKRLLYLLGDFDSLCRSVMTAAHIAIINRAEAQDWIEAGARLIRKCFGIVERYKNSGITRRDYQENNARYQAAVKRMGYRQFNRF